MTKNRIPNKKAICDVLVEAAKEDRDIIVLCSDSRGSASFNDFIDRYPQQVIEIGIAEQNLVGVSAGMASCGKKAFAVSPASFLSSRSIEQIKVDVCYSHTNVKLLGISGGVSYGALGMSHHSAQDVAYTASLPGMRVYLPSDRFQSAWLTRELLDDTDPAYIRVGRNPVEDIYDENTKFKLNQAKIVCEGTDIGIIACGDMVYEALQAAKKLSEIGIQCCVVDMYCLKPFDSPCVLNVAARTKAILSVEEHVRVGGLGSMVSQVLFEAGVQTRFASLTLPDEPCIAGTPTEVFSHYGLDAVGITEKCLELMKT